VLRAGHVTLGVTGSARDVVDGGRLLLDVRCEGGEVNVPVGLGGLLLVVAVAGKRGRGEGGGHESGNEAELTHRVTPVVGWMEDARSGATVAKKVGTVLVTRDRVFGAGATVVAPTHSPRRDTSERRVVDPWPDSTADVITACVS